MCVVAGINAIGRTRLFFTFISVQIMNVYENMVRIFSYFYEVKDGMFYLYSNEAEKFK